MRSVLYKGSRLVSGSKAFELHQAGMIKELDKHEKQLTNEAIARGELEPKKETNGIPKGN